MTTTAMTSTDKAIDKAVDKRRALGRGLDSLLPSGPRVVEPGHSAQSAVLPEVQASAARADAVVEIPLALIDENPYQTRYFAAGEPASEDFVATTLEELSAVTSRKALEERWVGIFQAPEALLTDRGSVFRERLLNDYMTHELGAYHIFTSAYYPQGNGINEAAHRGIEAAIAAAASVPGVAFEKVLQDAVAVHNATPHTALGNSPFKAMFGFEPTLPGWQRYRQISDTKTLAITRAEERQRAMMRAKLIAERLRLQEKQKLAVGDVIVYFMSDYERARCRPAASMSDAYTPKWSLPCRVISVKSGAVECEHVGCPGSRRQVPLSKVKLLKGDIPESLVQLNLTLIERETPRYQGSLSLKEPRRKKAIVEWKDIVDDETETLQVKRPKSTVQEVIVDIDG